MKDFFDFAGEHPFLTFFLFLIVGDTVVGVCKAIAVAIASWK